jgi:hypothetical protein
VRFGALAMIIGTPRVRRRNFLVDVATGLAARVVWYEPPRGKRFSCTALLA